MAINRISAAMTQEQKDSAGAAIKGVGDLMPFLVDIGTDERQSLPKLGDKSLAFVSKALELATQNPGFLPRDFDIEEFRKDLQLFADLSSIRQALAKLFDLVEDTMIVAGSEAYLSGLLVYSYAKEKKVGTAGLDSTIDELSRRFARKLGKSSGEEGAVQ